MKKTLKSLALAAACVLGVVGLASCGEPAHEHSYEYQSDATKHRQVCSDCEEATKWEAHKWGDWVETKPATLDEKGSHYRVCSVCEYKATEDIAQLIPAEGETSADWTAVYAQVPADWTDVNIYWWNGAGNGNLSDDYSVGWPGKPMTLVDEASHLYGYQLPKGVDHVIFNSNGVQTVDLTWSPDRNLFIVEKDAAAEQATASYKSYTPKDTDPELAKPAKNDPIEYVTMYVQLPEAWERCNFHFWGHVGPEVQWPGNAMTKVEGQENVWSFDKVIKGATGFIVNNKVDKDDQGNIQTANIENVPAEANAFIVTKDGDNYVGAPAKYENGKFTQLEVKVDKTIKELYVLGSMNDWKAANAAEQKLTIDTDKNEATIEIDLKENEEFKVTDSKWTGWSTFGYVDTLGAAFTGEAGGNIKVVTAGTYVIKVANLKDGETPTLTITAKPAGGETEATKNTLDISALSGTALTEDLVSGYFTYTIGVKSESIKQGNTSYATDNLTFERQVSLTTGKVQLDSNAGVFKNGIKFTAAKEVTVTVYAASKNTKTVTLSVLDAEGQVVTPTNITLDGVAKTAFENLPITDATVAKYTFTLPAGTFCLGGSAGGAYIYGLIVE